MSLISALDNAIHQIENTISTILGLADERLANSVGFFDEVNFDGISHANAVANTTNT